MLNARVSRVDISPVAGVAHAGWGAQTHQVSLGNDMPTLVTALVVTNNDVELAIVDVDILLFHPEQDQQIRGLISEKSGILYENIRPILTRGRSPTINGSSRESLSLKNGGTRYQEHVRERSLKRKIPSNQHESVSIVVAAT